MLSIQCGYFVGKLLSFNDEEVRVSVIKENTNLKEIVKKFIYNKFDYGYAMKLYKVKVIFIDNHGYINEKKFNNIKGNEISKKIYHYMFNFRAIRINIKDSHNELFKDSWIFVREYKKNTKNILPFFSIGAVKGYGIYNLEYEVIYNGGFESLVKCDKPINLIKGKKYITKIIEVGLRQTNVRLQGIEGCYNNRWFDECIK